MDRAFDFKVKSLLGFGPALWETPLTPGSSEKDAFENYVEEQLEPADALDKLYNAKIRDATIEQKLHKVGCGEPSLAKREKYKLRYYDKPLKDVWRLISTKDSDSSTSPELKEYDAFYRMPYYEAEFCAFYRAIYSKWQLRERLVEFWHNVIHANTISEYYSGDIAVAFADYDRTVIRRHCLGNYANLLKASAKHPVMLMYLQATDSNADFSTGRNGGLVENYAREVLELHTVGKRKDKDNFNQCDVKRLARAFSGWLFGHTRGYYYGASLGEKPKIDGEIYYNPKINQSSDYVEGEKFLGVKIIKWDRWANSDLIKGIPDDVEGMRLLEALAKHEETCRHMVRRLAAQFIDLDDIDQQTESNLEHIHKRDKKTIVNNMIANGEKAWKENQECSCQISKTIKAMLLTEGLLDIASGKAKTGFETVASLVRATGMRFDHDLIMYDTLKNNGASPYGWPTVKGRPDSNHYWLSTVAAGRRRRLIFGLAKSKSEDKTYRLDPLFDMAEDVTWNEAVKIWAGRFGLADAAPALLDDLAGYAANKRDVAARILPLADVYQLDRLREVVAVLASAPSFQLR